MELNIVQTLMNIRIADLIIGRTVTDKATLSGICFCYDWTSMAWIKAQLVLKLEHLVP